MKRSPDFDRMRRTLYCREPDRVPLAELQVDIKEQFLGEPVVDAAADVRFWQAAGYDYTIVFPFATHASEFASSWGSSRTVAADGRENERRWAPEGVGVISSMDDLERFAWPNPDTAEYCRIEETSACLPPGMGLICSIGGVWEFVRDLMGFEGFCMALADSPDLVDRMFRRVGEMIYGVFTNVMDFECVDAIWFCDDIAYTGGLVVSPDILRRYVFPVYKKMADVCRSRGIPTIYHSDGDLRQVVGDLLNVGINALHPIEPKAMDIAELKRDYGDRLCLIGNIDLGYTLTRGTPDEVRAEVADRIREIAPGGGYCVGSSNSVPDYVPVANYRAMIEATFEFGAY